MRFAGAIVAATVFVAAACGQVKDEPDASLDAAADTSFVDVSVPLDAAADVGVDVVADVAPETSVDAGACGAYESNGPYGCNKLLPAATQVPLTCVSEPAATGGAITDGYYELTSYEFDTNTFDASCPTGVSHAGIVMFCSGTMLWLDIDQNNSSFDSTGTYTTSGNLITVTPLSGCDGNKDSYEYTATPTTFEIRGGSPITQVLRYTLQ